MFPILLVSSLALSMPVDGTCKATPAAAHAAGNDIVEVALGDESFSTLVTALKAADLVPALRGEGPFTVFAPTNEAFAKLPADQLARLLEPENQGLLRSILTYHVVAGRLAAQDVLARSSATTLNGQRIDFRTTDDGATVDGASIVKTDIACSNGVIHVVDSVILPSTLDVVATAVEAGSFDTLAAALKAARLVETLQGDGPFTVFAPTDEAFAALPKGTVESLLEPANREKLASILTFHVVPGRVYADRVAAGATLETVGGGRLTTRTHEGHVLVNGARVLEADVEASNGVIHVIDAVLLPE